MKDLDLNAALKKLSEETDDVNGIDGVKTFLGLPTENKIVSLAIDFAHSVANATDPVIQDPEVDIDDIKEYANKCGLPLDDFFDALIVAVRNNVKVEVDENAIVAAMHDYWIKISSK
jgi:hypothetical protein